MSQPRRYLALTEHWHFSLAFDADIETAKSIARHFGTHHKEAVGLFETAHGTFVARYEKDGKPIKLGGRID